MSFPFQTVQNGSMHQKDGVNDDDFEPYLSSQTNQVNLLSPFKSAILCDHVMVWKNLVLSALQVSLNPQRGVLVKKILYVNSPIVKINTNKKSRSRNDFREPSQWCYY